MLSSTHRTFLRSVKESGSMQNNKDGKFMRREPDKQPGSLLKHFRYLKYFWLLLYVATQHPMPTTTAIPIHRYLSQAALS